MDKADVFSGKPNTNIKLPGGYDGSIDENIRSDSSLIPSKLCLGFF